VVKEVASGEWRVARKEKRKTSPQREQRGAEGTEISSRVIER
jgi:hypothetical protein